MGWILPQGFYTHYMLTCTTSKWQTFIRVEQNIVYTPYFAEWPMESNLPSPAHMTSFMCFNLQKESFWNDSQWLRTMGNKKCLWCLKKFLAEYTERAICRNTSKILLIEAPADSTAKLKSRLAAGYRPFTNGCDLHEKPSKQLEQVCFTVTIVPLDTMETVGLSFLQLKQNVENRLSNIW